jgi:hypothetical protein
MKELKPYVPVSMKPPPAPTPAPKLTNAELEQRRQQGGNPADAVEYQSRQLDALTQKAQKILDSQHSLKESVNQLQYARRVDIAILIVGTIAAIATVILLFR